MLTEAQRLFFIFSADSVGGAGANHEKLHAQRGARGVVEEAAVGQLLPLLASALGVAPSAISTELHSAGLDTWDAFDIFASKLAMNALTVPSTAKCSCSTFN